MPLDPYYSPSYEEIHNACEQFVSLFDKFDFQFKHIVGVSRGGLFPAVILSHLLDIPMTPVCYSSKHGNGDNRNHENVLPTFTKQQSPLLVVDDICDSGHTLNELKQDLTNQGIDVYTCVLFDKVRIQRIHDPDFKWRKVADDGPWIVFPFEK